MEIVCIFCGEKPKTKTREHVLPRWLIEETGDIKRIAEFGYKDILNPDAGKRIYSWDSFQFPACEACNNRFSELESNTKAIVEKILSEQAITSPEFGTLLDWFDKVRIGLWLGFRYLEKDAAGVIPKFHISQRIGAYDRMLGVYKQGSNSKALHIIGCDMPTFRYTPSCFSLRINQYWFINISMNDLFSRRIGFPYASESFLLENGLLECSFSPGRNRIMMPLLKKRFLVRGTEIYQPMFKYNMQTPYAKELYDSQYVKDNSLSLEKGEGKVFISENDRLIQYPTEPSSKWIPKVAYSFQSLAMKIMVQTLEFHDYIDSFVSTFS